MKKILIVDDQVMNRLLISQIIIRNEPVKYDISEAVDGADAVEKCLDTDYDLVFMDFNMPVMNGNDATIKIKETKPNTIIVSITTAMTELKQEIFDGFLIKPFNIDGVIGVINEFIKKI